MVDRHRHLLGHSLGPGHRRHRRHRQLRRHRPLRHWTAWITLIVWAAGFLFSRMAGEPGESSVLLIPGSVAVILLAAVHSLASFRAGARGAALNAGFAAALAVVAIAAAMYPRIDYAGVPYLLAGVPIGAMIIAVGRQPRETPETDSRPSGASGRALAALAWTTLGVGAAAIVFGFLPEPFWGVAIIAFYGGLLLLFALPAGYLSVALLSGRYRCAATAAATMALVLAWPIMVRIGHEPAFAAYLAAIGILLTVMAILPKTRVAA